MTRRSLDNVPPSFRAWVTWTFRALKGASTTVLRYTPGVNVSHCLRAWWLGLTLLPAFVLGCALGQAPVPQASPVVQVAEVSPSPAAAIPEVEFTSADYTISGLAQVPAGVTRIRLRNQGQHAHQVAVLQLAGGRTSEDLLAALRENPEGGLPEFARWMGGPNVVDAGGEAIATIDLPPGVYAVACFMPDAEGKSHVLRGMIAPFRVLPDESGATAAPRPEITITEVEFGFGLFEPIPPGLQTIGVRNDGRQPHELQMALLVPGKTVEDYIAAADQTGPTTGRSVGGLAPLEPGSAGSFTYDFTPGRYALLCFLIDPATKQPHYRMGMLTEFTIAGS